MEKDEAHEDTHLPTSHNTNTDDVPDGGYGLVICVCMFLQNAATWGVNTAFGVYLSFYRKTDFFPGATDLQFAFIGGLSIALSLFVAPLSNYLSGRYNFKVSMLLGLCVYTSSQILAAFSHKIWQLVLTQGVLFGIGSGLIFVASVALPSQWFLKKRALALGIGASGSGAGGLLLSITTRLAIERLSLRWAFIINAAVSFSILLPVIILLRDRVRMTNSQFHPFQYRLLFHPGFLWIWTYGCINVLGYILSLYTLATYSTAGLGFSQTRGATLQAILAAGQMIGRPICGWWLDRLGRINMTACLAFISGLSCLVIWMFGRSFSVLIFFAIIQGLFGGTVWGASAPVTVEIVGLQDLGSALAIFWVALSIPAVFAEAIGVSLIDYSQTKLHRTGADAYLIAIGFAGACFCVSGLLLLGAKRYRQGDWQLFKKA